VEKIRSGNLEHRTVIKTSDEIEELAEEFNQMTEALRNSCQRQAGPTRNAGVF
jgi:HAMP domain-containing protein